MRKYIIAFLFIAAGLILIFLGFSKRSNKNVYAENAFAQHVKDFDTIFNDFAGAIRNDLSRIRKVYTDTLQVKDTLQNRQFFLDELGNSDEMITIAFFQNRFKVVGRRDGSSLIYAVDSTTQMDVVRWQRFEGSKQISSWNESFEDEVEKSDWYKKLISVNNQSVWFSLNNRSDINLPEEEGESIYCGYSYEASGSKSIIVLEFSKERLLKRFGSKVKNLSPLLKVKTTDGRMLEFTPASSMSESYKDSLEEATTNHFKRFDSLKTGTFNFSFKNEVYWNAFRRFEKELGLEYYLFTINNRNLSSYTAASESRLYLWIGGALLVLGILLTAIRKRFFYRPNQMEMPSLEKLLEDDENRFLEFKSSLRWDYRQEKANPDLEKVILKTLAAFGNTDGGILLIGVDDDKKIIGLEKDFQSLKRPDADYYEIHLRNLLHKEMGVKYVSKHIRTQFETTVNGETVCKIKVIPGDEPQFLKVKDKNGKQDEKFYVRSGNSSQEIVSMAEINDYVNKRFK
jgi:hypothetical protein